jgi:hypothetical protein
MFHTLRSVKPRAATEQSAYDRWMDQTLQREQARVARAEGIMPLPVWGLTPPCDQQGRRV